MGDEVTKVIYLPEYNRDLQTQQAQAQSQLQVQPIQQLSMIMQNPLLFILTLPAMPLLMFLTMFQTMFQPMVTQPTTMTMPVPQFIPKFTTRRIEVVRDEDGRIIRIVDTVETI